MGNQTAVQVVGVRKSDRKSPVMKVIVTVLALGAVVTGDGAWVLHRSAQKAVKPVNELSAVEMFTIVGVLESNHRDEDAIARRVRRNQGRFGTLDQLRADERAMEGDTDMHLLSAETLTGRGYAFR